MHSLQEIKSRITAIKKIKKITKAMQLVATAKLIQSKRSLTDVRNYHRQVDDVFKMLVNSSDGLDQMFKLAKKNGDLYILITSDLGLCGSYNSHVIKIAKANIKNYDQIIIVGIKGSTIFKKVANKLVTFNHLGDHPNYLVASDIAQLAITKFLTNEVKAIKIIHTKYINAITHEPTLTNIVPFDVTKAVQTTIDYEFEPNSQVIIKNALPLYVAAVIYKMMTESKLVEITSRRTAMENATDNANELIDNLDLEYNRARQAKITQEISEIVAGSEL